MAEPLNDVALRVTLTETLPDDPPPEPAAGADGMAPPAPGYRTVADISFVGNGEHVADLLHVLARRLERDLP